MRAIDLQERIREQDKLHLEAWWARVDQRFVDSILAVRNDEVRDLGATWGTKPVTGLRVIR